MSTTIWGSSYDIWKVYEGENDLCGYSQLSQVALSVIIQYVEYLT